MCGFVGTINLFEDLNQNTFIEKANDLLKKEDLMQKVFLKITFAILVSEDYQLLIYLIQEINQ